MFRSNKMTAKPKADQKAAQAGPTTGGQTGGPGASTTPPPPLKPTTLPPGAPSKAQTPRKGPQSSGKIDKPSTGKLKIDETAPKGDPKNKQPEPPKVESMTKPGGGKGKEKPTQLDNLNPGAQARAKQHLFEPAEHTPLNFYNPVPEFESETEAMDEGNDAEGTKGLKRKVPPMVDEHSSEDEEEEEVGEAELVENLVQTNREAEQRNQELIAELNAEKHKFKLLAKSQNIPPQVIASHMMAAELEEDQYQDARGDYVDTGPSSYWQQ